MYGDQFGEFVCGYWDLKGYAKETLSYKNGFARSLVLKVRDFGPRSDQ